MTAEIIDIQTGVNTPPPAALTAASNLLSAPERTIDRLRHMPESVYDLTPESHIVRFAQALVGDAGAGRLRKSFLSRRLQGDLRGARFLDLDRFYGAIFNIGRTPDEALGIDPYTQPATSAQWQEVSISDASYRTRIEQFARAIPWGASPLGIELAAEALLNCDVDIIESYNDPLNPNERMFQVFAKRPLENWEQFMLHKVLTRLKPADALMDTSNSGIEIHVNNPIAKAYADSEYWEVVNKVSTTNPLVPYLNRSGDEPVEQPRPPFSAYQGEAWTYNSEIVTIGAFVLDADGNEVAIAPAIYVAPDGTVLHLGPEKALIPVSSLLAGRYASDGVVTASPYYDTRHSNSGDTPTQFDSLTVDPTTGATDQVYADRIPLDALATVIDQQSVGFLLAPKTHDDYWLANTRALGSEDVDILDIHFLRPVLCNYIAFDAAHFPSVISTFVQADTFQWIEVDVHAIYDAVPTIIPNQPPNDFKGDHPEHYAGGHWSRVTINNLPQRILGMKLVLSHDVPGGKAPVDIRGNAASYSLAIRNLEIGHRVTSLNDVPHPVTITDDDWPIDSSLDIFGNLVLHDLRIDSARNLVDGDGIWRSEPQPVRDAVVNLYLDVRKVLESHLVKSGAYDSVHLHDVVDLDAAFLNITGPTDGADLLDTPDTAAAFLESGVYTLSFDFHWDTDAVDMDILIEVDISATGEGGGASTSFTLTGVGGTDESDGFVLGPFLAYDGAALSIQVTTTTSDPVDGPSTVTVYVDNMILTGTMLTVTDSDDDAPVIDRFIMDPITIGVQTHLYYSNSDPSGLPFEAIDEALLTPEPLGVLGSFEPSPTDGLTFPDGDVMEIGLDNNLLHVNFEQSWWTGITFRPQYASTDPTIVPDPYPDVVLDDAPTYYFRLGDAGANAAIADSSPNGLIGQCQAGARLLTPGAIIGDDDGAATFAAAGFPGIAFDATGAFCPTNADYTIEFWLLPGDNPMHYFFADDDTPAVQHIVEVEYDTSETIAGVNRRIRMTVGSFGPGLSINTENGRLHKDQWSHIVATYVMATSFATIYIDGEIAAQGNLDPFIATDTSWVSTPNNFVNIESTQGPDYGGFDELAVYPTALSQDRVRLHHRSGVHYATHPIFQVGNIKCGIRSNNLLELTSSEVETFALTIPTFFAQDNILRVIIAFLTEDSGPLKAGWHLIFKPVVDRGVGGIIVEQPLHQTMNRETFEGSAPWAIGHGFIDVYFPYDPTVSPPGPGIVLNPHDYGQFPMFFGGDSAAYKLDSAVIKQEALTDPAAHQYFLASESFTIKPPFPVPASRRWTDNAVVRYNKKFIDVDINPYGFVGGPGDPYAYMAWLPIPRDYELQKGYLHLPPTRARFWKFEFTGLTPEPYESFLPILRNVKTFPGAVAATVPTPGTDSSTVTGAQSNVGLAADSPYAYRDVTPARATTIGQPTELAYGPTDAFYATQPNVAANLRDQSWVYSLQPWQRLAASPQHQVAGVHDYDEVEVEHTTKIGFFVGLNSIMPVRVDFTVPDDTFVIVDRYHDTTNVAPDYEWVFRDPALAGNIGGFYATEDLEYPAVYTSRVFPSNSDVIALQFATQQSPAVQLVDDDTFDDPFLIDYNWGDDGFWHRVGDSFLTYKADKKLLAVSRSDSGEIATLDGGDGVLNVPVHPVLRWNPTEVVIPGHASGGIATGTLTPSAKGTIWAAVRFIATTDIANPLVLEITDPAETTVYARKEFTAKAGQTIEDFVGLIVGNTGGPDTSGGVRVRLVQYGASIDAWEIDALSLFDDRVTWEFSNNAGSTWEMAHGIRNDPYGVLRFPSIEDGNQLMYRVTAYSAGCWVNSVQIRPWYANLLVARRENPQRWGPNISSFDQQPSIIDDPEFNVWTKPIPRSWFREGRLFPYLPTAPTDPFQGVPQIGRTGIEYIPTSDEATRMIMSHRFAFDDVSLAGDEALVSSADLGRSPSDDISIVDDDVADWDMYISPPNGAPAGGTVVTIRRSAGGLTGALGVKFGATSGTSVTVVDDNTITVHAPAGTVDTVVDVTVELSDTTFTASTSTTKFGYLAVPNITHLDVNFGPSTGGTVVTITGTHLTRVTDVFVETVPGATDIQSGDFEIVDDTTIIFTTPALGSPTNSGVYAVLARNALGQTSGYTFGFNSFSFIGRPTVSSVSPSSGTHLGGTTVDVTGTNFVDIDAVNFGLTAGFGLTIISPTHLQIGSPAHAAGLVDITVVNDAGTSATSSGDHYTYT